MRLASLLMSSLACVLVGAAAPGADDEGLLSEEQTLRAAGLTTDGPALLDFFRKRAAVTVEQEKLRALVRQLGDASPAVADRAAGELVAFGPPAVPWLRQALREADDTQRAARARRCLGFLESGEATPLTAAAARVLAARRPPGAAEVLLAYLPFADDEAVIDEVRQALSAVVLRDGKPEPAVLQALEGNSSLRRSVAAEALCQAGAETARPALSRLLKDSRPGVRLRVALALADLREPAAVAALIDLLAELPGDQARPAEEYLTALAGEQAPKVTLGADAESRQKCRDAWAAWWKGTENANLLDELRKRTLPDEVRARALVLIGQLGEDSFDLRKKASTGLVEMGPAIAPLLRQAVADPDVEVARRIQDCLEAVEKNRPPALSPVVIRLAALRRPAGTVETLLAYIPSAENETVAGEVQSALTALALLDGKPDPVLARALGDKVGVRRAAAAAALCRSGSVDMQPAVRKLLNDPEPVARLRVAQALVAVRDKEAVPVLVELLASSHSVAQQSQAVLQGLAGERGPKTALGRDAAGRQLCRDAWAAWWREHGSSIELAARPSLPARQLGYTVIALIENGQVIEIDREGKVRWQLAGLQYPADVQVLPGDRVLIAEYHVNRVTERNLKNEVLWEKRVNGSAVNCQRLPNGNTFIASRMQLMEVDPAGKEVFVHNRPNGDIQAARRLRDGQIVCALSNGNCMRLDAAGKEVKTFPIGQVHLGSLEVLPNGRVLVPLVSNNKVVEYDAEGKIVWEAAVTQPLGAVRLPNGNTLVSSYANLLILELDRAGRTVWEHKTSGRPARVRRR